MTKNGTEERKQLTSAWQAAARRLIKEGYDPEDVFNTMAAVALDRSISEPTAEVVVDRSTRPQPTIVA